MAAQRTESSYLRGRPGARRHLRRRHGDQPPGAGAHRRRFRRPRPRGVQRAAGGDPSRRGRQGPPFVLRGRLRRGRDRHLRGLRPGVGRVRTQRPGPRAQPGGHGHRPQGGRRLLDPGQAPLGGRQHRSGHQVPHPGPDQIRRSARRLRGAGRRAHRGRRRPHHHRDGLRPAAGQGGHQRGPAGHEAGRGPPTHPVPGDHRADRDHAARHRGRAPPWSPSRPWTSTSSGSTAPPGRRRCSSRCAT